MRREKHLNSCSGGGIDEKFKNKIYSVRDLCLYIGTKYIMSIACTKILFDGVRYANVCDAKAIPAPIQTKYIYTE